MGEKQEASMLQFWVVNGGEKDLKNGKRGENGKRRRKKIPQICLQGKTGGGKRVKQQNGKKKSFFFFSRRASTLLLFLLEWMESNDNALTSLETRLSQWMDQQV